MKFRLTFGFLLTLLSYQMTRAQGVWTQKASLPSTGREDAMYFSIGTKGYSVGGAYGFSVQDQSLWEYDAISNTWVQKQNFIGKRCQGVAFGIGTKGYAGLGVDSAGTFQNDFWEYDPIADTWTQKANYTAVARVAAVGFSIGNKGYVGTGLSNIAVGTPDFYEYDPVANSWTQKANIPISRSYAFGMCIGSKGYVGTGEDATGNSLGDFWEYDPSTNGWTQKSNFPGGQIKDIDGEHFSIGNCGYVGKGNVFWKYDPANDTWTSIPNLPAIGRIGAIGFSMNNTGYIGCGFVNSSNVLNDLWSFDEDMAVDSGAVIEFPNVFTPNGDGVNDNFIPVKYWGITKTSLRIYNRWGEEVFYTTDILKGWNGYHENHLCSDGTYFWTAEYTTSQNVSHKSEGFLTLMK